MDEIDERLRKALGRRDQLSEDAVSEQQQRARQRLATVIDGQPVASSSWRSRAAGRGVKRGVAVVAALLVLPAGYAIADATGVINDDGALTRSECEQTRAGQPASADDSVSCAELREDVPTSAPTIRRLEP